MQSECKNNNEYIHIYVCIYISVFVSIFAIINFYRFAFYRKVIFATGSSQKSTEYQFVFTIIWGQRIYTVRHWGPLNNYYFLRQIQKIYTNNTNRKQIPGETRKNHGIRPAKNGFVKNIELVKNFERYIYIYYM